MGDGADSALTVWDVATGEVVISDRIPGLGASAMYFSPDGAFGVALFGSPGAGSPIRIYELDSFTVVAEPVTPDATWGVVFTPNGSVAISHQFGGTLTYHDTADWSIIDQVAAHQGSVYSIDISPSGAQLASVGDDGVRVWNVADQSLHTKIATTAGPMAIATFIDDTHLLVVPEHSAQAFVITLDPSDLVDIAKSRVTRAFRDDECATYGIGPCPTTLEALRGE